MSTYAGGETSGHQDGDRMRALFNSPYRLTVNQETGDLYVSDYGNQVIRKITAQGVFV